SRRDGPPGAPLTSELAQVGAPLACAGLAAVIVAPRRDLRLAGIGAAVIGSAFLAAYLAPARHRAAYAAAAVLGLAVAAALAWLFSRWPWLLPMAALACAPARIPVHVGKTDANLLLPMYAVVAGAVVLLTWELLRGDRRARELGPFALPLAAFV